MLELFFTFLIGLLGSIVGAIAGGGGGLITAPYFILIGIPPHIGLATSKFGGIGVSISSIAKFRKTEYLRWDYTWYFVALSIPAALLGANILLATNDEVIRKIVAIMLLIATPVFLFNKTGLVQKQVSNLRKQTGYIVFFILRMLQAAFGSGIGMFVTMVYMYFFGLTALEASATRRIPTLVAILLTVVVFAYKGVILYDHGIALLTGGLVGGYVGTHIAIEKGNKFVKRAFVVVLVLIAIKLFI